MKKFSMNGLPNTTKEIPMPKVTPSKLTPEQEKQSRQFVNVHLNKLINSQRKIFDGNSLDIFYLGESYAQTEIKKEIHKKGSMTEAEYDDILAGFLKTTTVGKFLEIILKELYDNFAKEDIEKLHSESEDAHNEDIIKEEI